MKVGQLLLGADPGGGVHVYSFFIPGKGVVGRMLADYSTMLILIFFFLFRAIWGDVLCAGVCVFHVVMYTCVGVGVGVCLPVNTRPRHPSPNSPSEETAFLEYGRVPRFQACGSEEDFTARFEDALEGLDLVEGLRVVR